MKHIRLFSAGLRLMKVALFLSIGLVFLAQPAFAKLGYITVEQLHQKMVQGDKLNLVDVRSPERYAEFNLGATNLTLAMIGGMEFDPIEDVKDEEVIVMCATGVESMQAAQLLNGAAFRNVKILQGGILEWINRYGYKLPEVKSAPEPTPAKTPSPQPKAPEPPKFIRIEVGNLSADTTEDALRELFEQFGEVKSVAIETDEDGNSKGTAYVEMSAEKAEEAASTLNGKELDGKKITVKKAEPED